MVHASDLAPALVAFDARARIVGPDGMRVLPLEEFFLPPGLDPRRENVLGQADVLTDVLLPPAPAGWASSYVRATEPHTHYALASVASTMLVQDGRVAQVSVILGVGGADAVAVAGSGGGPHRPRGHADGHPRGRRRRAGRRRAARRQPLQGRPVQGPARGGARDGRRAQAPGLSMPWRRMWEISPTTSSVLLP